MKIQDEPWYDDWITVAEILQVGMDDRCFEEIPDGFNLAVKAAKDYFSKCQKPNWTPPTEDQLKEWIRQMWLPEDFLKEKS